MDENDMMRLWQPRLKQDSKHRKELYIDVEIEETHHESFPKTFIKQ